MTSFWDELDALIAALDEAPGAPDPWADLTVPNDDLSEAQRTFLEGLEDQPPRPKIDSGDAGG